MRERERIRLMSREKETQKGEEREKEREREGKGVHSRPVRKQGEERTYRPHIPTHRKCLCVCVCVCVCTQYPEESVELIQDIQSCMEKVNAKKSKRRKKKKADGE